MRRMITKSIFGKSKETQVSGVPEGFDGFVLGSLFNEDVGTIIHVSRDDKRAALLISAINFFFPNIKTIYFPSWDCLPFDRSGPRLTIQAERLAALSLLFKTTKNKRIIVTTVNAITQRVVPKSHIKNLNYELTVGKKTDLSELKYFLSYAGYLETPKVLEVGEYSIRGGIVDVFPPLTSLPIRFDFFGDLLENARLFSISDQRSMESVTGCISITAVREVCLGESHIASFKKNYLKNFGIPNKSDYLYQTVLSGKIFPGYEHWLPYFYNDMDTLFDFVSNPVVSFDSGLEVAVEARFKQISEYYEMRIVNCTKQTKFNSIFNPINSHEMYLEKQELQEITSNLEKLYLSEFYGKKLKSDLDLGGHIGKNFSIERQTEGIDLLKSAADYILSEEKRGNLVLIAAYSQGSLERLKKLLNDQNILELDSYESCVWSQSKQKYVFVQEGEFSSKRIGLNIFPIESGFVVPGLTLISEQDILGKRLYRKNKYNKKIKNPLKEFSEICLGDLVVHVDHGLGKYVGFQTIMAAGIPHDCLLIQYADQNKLFLPVENINLLSKYGQEIGQLDRLGSLGWQNRRAKTKRRINELALSLIKVAAERQMNKGVIHIPDPSLWDKFCSRFQFEETEDQETAIRDVLQDLSSGLPMDRLICGDVGFGKTEVALRAALTVALNDFQVVVLAPTTLLARQHFLTFVDRFKDVPINIEKFTRFESSKDKEIILNKLHSGQVDILVGTHALLSAAGHFKNLGLLVIDEEQHFGVAQKEVIKKFRSNVHVLTLTATPIPRTLQLSLTGVRDLSLISTPPVDRLLVRTFVMEFDSIIIREALLREKNRGGQSFFVVPRISDIDQISRYLTEEIPEIHFQVVHGKISGAKLDEVLGEFQGRKIDLLLSTSIVESGLDFPNSNTLIVYRAEMFGLSQLYQIRGRVGRSKIRAYCYLTYDHTKKLTSQGENRLRILSSLNSLGQGFALASQDLDLRGAGNLLGDEQSGDIKEVGFELYQSMLKDEIEKLKTGESVPEYETKSPKLDLNVPVLIPENYVKDLGVRLSLYRELALLKTDNELDEFCERLLDRFGPIPSEINTLLDVMRVKNSCSLAGINILKAGSRELWISFYDDKFSDPDGLMHFIQKNKSKIKVKDNKLIISIAWENDQEKMKVTQKILQKLASMAQKNALLGGR